MKSAPILGVLVALASQAHADDRTRAHATRRSSDISIDGRLDEPAWQGAERSGKFTQRFPKDGGTPSFDTQFAILYDDDALYVGVWSSDPEPSKIKAQLTRRDLDVVSDAVAIGIDSYHDRRTAFVFQLNAAGVQRDFIIFDDANTNDSWDAVWTGDAAITAEGWTAEFRIPLSQLRYPEVTSQAWGFQAVRMIGRTTEQDAWSPWPRSGGEIVSKFGVVDRIENLTPKRRLELLPYVTAGTLVHPISAGDPLNDRVDPRGNVGLDVKYGLGPAFTLSATINPDFGQVEADPSQVNLSGNELFFAEKRPFFLEGADLFRLPIGNSSNTVEGAFYSRRIGADASDPSQPYDYIARPDGTTIYGAAKLTGKTSSGWSIGAFDAVTAQEKATIELEAERREVVVAPLTNYAVARVKRDLRDGLTTVGASMTAVHRSLTGTPLADVLHDQAYTAGAQVSHRWAKNAWAADLAIVTSLVHGSPRAIERTQRLFRHLYQRPDASHLGVDPTRTSLTGYDITASIGQFGDTKHWRYGLGLEARSPGLELNDAGFQSSSDRALAFIYMEYHDEDPTDAILNWNANHDIFAFTTFEPELQAWGYECNAFAQLANYWSLGTGCNIAFNQWYANALRGGPALHGENEYNGYLNINTDSRKHVFGSLNTGLNYSPGNRAIAGNVDLGATIQARSNLDIFVGPSWSSRFDSLQYIDEVQDTTGTPHYIFGSLDQTTIGLTLRVNWTFSPHLALQAYAQPFVASVRFSELKDVDNPHAENYADRFHTFQGREYSEMDGTIRVDRDRDGTVDYELGRPDFSFRELRSTVVLRWEYRPGSNLYSIWSHGRTSVADDGRFMPRHDLDELFRSDSENIVMVKLNYWLGF